LEAYWGLLMLVVILKKMRGKVVVKLSLSMFLFIGSLIVLIGSFTYSGKAIYFPHIFRLDSPLHYLFGPVCFFYTLASFKSDFKFRWIQLLNLLPFLMNLIEFTPFFLSSASVKAEQYTALFTSGSLILPMHAIIKTSISTIYLILQWVVFFKYKPDDLIKRKANRYLVSWFLIFLTTQSGMLIGLFINIFTSFKLFDDAYQYTITVEAFYLYTAAIALLFYPALLYGIRLLPLHKKKSIYSRNLHLRKKTLYLIN
jgi:hypothetical protein